MAVATCHIPSFISRLRQGALITDDDIAAIEKAVAAEVDDAVAFADAGTLEPVDNLTRFVYSERRTS